MAGCCEGSLILVLMRTCMCAAFASLFLALSDQKKFTDVAHEDVNDDDGDDNDAGAGAVGDVPGPTAGTVCGCQPPACGGADGSVTLTALHKYRGSSTASWTPPAGLDSKPAALRTNGAPCPSPGFAPGHVQDPADCYHCVSTLSWES